MKMTITDRLLTEVLRRIYGARIQPIYDVVPGSFGLPVHQLVGATGTLHNGMSFDMNGNTALGVRRAMIATVKHVR